MNSVLMIAHSFPPEGNAGTYRSLRFVRQLTKIGWQTAVISVTPHRYERHDPELQSLVPSETEVTYVRARDPWQGFQAWRAGRAQTQSSSVSPKERDGIRSAQHSQFRSGIREAVRTAEEWFYYPDRAAPWIKPAADAAVQACRSRRADVIWASALPISSWLVAERASRRIGVPYVLDLRDPYGLNYYESEQRRPYWSRRADRRNLYRLFEGAQPSSLCLTP